MFLINLSSTQRVDLDMLQRQNSFAVADDFVDPDNLQDLMFLDVLIVVARFL